MSRIGYRKVQQHKTPWIAQFQLPYVHESHLISTTGFYFQEDVFWWGIDVLFKRGNAKKDLIMVIFSKDLKRDIYVGENRSTCIVKTH